jgi:hypothetical protein
MSTLVISSPDKPTINPPHRKLAPHRKHAKKFLTLPDELLTNIAAKKFVEKRLAHRRFLFTEYSLKGLVDMTAHPVFGPCIKSIMFGTDRLTDQLGVLMTALESHGITDPAKSMEILQIYRERSAEQSKFLESRHLSRLLVVALSSLSSHGTSVSLGIFNDIRKYRRKEVLMHGYGFSCEYGNLPFAKFMTHNWLTLGHIRAACRNAHFRPKFLEFDLTGQEESDGMRTAIKRLMLSERQPRFNFDVCIRQGPTDIRILSSRGLVEFEQRSSIQGQLSAAESCEIHLSWLRSPVLDALFAVPITHFRMKSCTMWSTDIIMLLQHLAECLQVVELVDAIVMGDLRFRPVIHPVLRCLRDDMQLQRLVLNDLRAWDQEFTDPPGCTIAKQRLWNGQQQINEGLDVLIEYEYDGYDGGDCHDDFERGIRDSELELQEMNCSGDSMKHTKYMRGRAELEGCLMRQKEEYEEYKVRRAEAKEAMARVEAGEFST